MERRQELNLIITPRYASKVIATVTYRQSERFIRVYIVV